MTKKVECEIVQDLLPIYVDGLTHEVTSKVVDEHLKTCEVCEEVYTLMKEPEEKSSVEEPKQLHKFLKRIRNKGLVTGVMIVTAFWFGWIGYQKLFIDEPVLAVNQIVIEDLAMRTDGQLQFTIKDIKRHRLTWIYGEGTPDGESKIWSYQAGRPLLEGPLSKNDLGIEHQSVIDVEGFNKVIYQDDNGNELVIWEEGMDLPVIEAPAAEEFKAGDDFDPNYYRD